MILDQDRTIAALEDEVAALRMELARQKEVASAVLSEAEARLAKAREHVTLLKAAAAGERLVHAAGICLPAPLAEQPVDEIDRTIAVNFLGTGHMVKAVLTGMLDRRRGDVVAFASLAGWLPSPHLGAYSASKHAVVAFMEVLAYENRGSGVRFACVCPPVVDTPMAAAIRARDAVAIGGQGGIDPSVVVDAIDRSLEAGELFVLPGKGTKSVWRARRFAPRLIWRQVERATSRGA